MDKEYYSFMLRLRQMEIEDAQTWIISMQNTQTGHRQVFSNVEGLIEFLQTEFGCSTEQEEADRPIELDPASPTAAIL